MKARILTILIFLLLGPAFGQTGDDPLEGQLMLSLQDIGPEFEGFEDSERTVGASGPDILSIVHRTYLSRQPPFGSSDNIYEMSIGLGHCKSLDEAREAWWYASQTNGSHLQLEPAAFDLGRSDFVARGDYPTGLFRLMLDRVIVFVEIPKIDQESDAQHKSRVNQILTKLFDRIDSLNEEPLPSFLFDFQSTRSQSTMEFSLTPLQELPFGVDVRYTIWREGPARERVVEVDLGSGSGSITEVVGLSEFSEGSYTLTVTAWDNYLSRVLSFRVPFDVSPSSRTDQVLSTSTDTTLTQRHPHQNEGANPVLTLEKIQGKAARSAVAFDLANVDLSGLSKATLVLTIDPGQHVNGWGNGRTVSVQALNAAWHEGNGKSFGYKKKDAVSGTGSGATWFSPVDENIGNDSTNSVVNWDGGAASAYPPTAPAAQLSNHQSGTVEFDVTADLLNGAQHGWLIKQDNENVGAKVSFYSREGAAAAGNQDLAPRLLLEFGDPVASAPSGSLLSRLGFGSVGNRLQPTSSTELRSVKQLLQQSPATAYATEQLLSEATRQHPLLNITTRIAYRSWLNEEPSLAGLALPVC